MDLSNFDEIFFNSIKDRENILIKSNGIYHTLKLNGNKVGIVGFIPGALKHTGFVQILICPEYRGKGLLQKAEDLLAKKYQLKTLLTTIEENNLASIKSHLKAGFKPLDGQKIKELREKRLLDKNKIRLVKCYSDKQL